VVISVASFLLIPPLNQALHEIYVKNRVVRLHIKQSGWLANSDVHSGSIKIEKINVEYRDDVLHVVADIFATRNNLKDAQQRIDKFQTLLSAEIGEPIAVEVDIIPIDLVRIRSTQPKIDKQTD
jgi:hypothetical protein